MSIFSKEKDGIDKKKIVSVITKVRNIKVVPLPTSGPKDIETQIKGALRGIKGAKTTSPYSGPNLRLIPEIIIDGIPIEIKCATNPEQFGWLIGQSTVYLEKHQVVVGYLYDRTGLIKKEMATSRGKQLETWLKSRGIYLIIKP